MVMVFMIVHVTGEMRLGSAAHVPAVPRIESESPVSESHQTLFPPPPSPQKKVSVSPETTIES